MTDRITILKTDITRLAVDAIVNAAGPELLAECRQLGGCNPGQAKLSKGYRLPARFIVHTVGPIWNGGIHNEAGLLASCYRSCFTIAREKDLRTLAFPAISCGIYGYPIDQAVEIATRETFAELRSNQNIERIIFACSSDEIVRAYRHACPAA
jgi:O-acetyl-ADP-ribose deacetylase (regulator of RNase III)